VAGRLGEADIAGNYGDEHALTEVLAEGFGDLLARLVRSSYMVSRTPSMVSEGL